MFVIVYNNSVILGPMRWNRFRFENEIFEECEMSVTLPDRNDTLSPILVSPEVKILPINGSPDPVFNSKIEFLHGPFWTITDTEATSSYQVGQYPVDAVKNMLKAKVAENRWKKTNAGVDVILNGINYVFPTDSNTRSILRNAVNCVNFKYDLNTWISMTSADVAAVIYTIDVYIQQCFNWELRKCNEIDACLDLTSLDAVVLE